MRWIEENWDLFNENCILAAVNLGLADQVNYTKLKGLVDKGYVQIVNMFTSKFGSPTEYKLTSSGQEKYDHDNKLIQQFYIQERDNTRQ